VDQSFDVLENSPPNSEVGSVIATDPDNGQSLTYTIISGNVDNTFELESSSGLLSLSSTAVLDFGTTPVYNLMVEVEDNGNGNLSSQAEITVNVFETNQPPEIEEQGFDVIENSTNGSVIGTIEATDPDNGQTLTFSILSGNTDNAFSVESNTGVLMVDNTSAINFEANPIFNLTVEVEDNGPGNLTDQAVVTVTLIDINEPPVMSPQTFSIDENSQDNTEVGLVVANDPDNGQTLTYSIVSGNVGNAFAIESNSGLLTVSNSLLLNFENIPTFTLMVEVEDNGTGSLSSQADITINLNDVNEVPIMEDQNFVVVENTPNGSEVGVMVATDPDDGQTLTFSIIGGNQNGAFEIGNNTGRITVANSSTVNFENIPEFTLTVEVEDDGTGNLSDQAIVIVTVTDINEPPIMVPQNFAIEENSANATQLGTIEATDPDNGQTLTYSIISGNPNNALEVGSTSGILSVANSTALNFENIPAIILVIKVEDNGTGNLFTQALVSINLIDVNEPPIVIPQNFAIDVSSDLIENELNNNVIDVGTVLAMDPDAGQSVSYSIIAGNESNMWSLESNSGEVKLEDPYQLSPIEIANYPLTIEVTDNSPEQLSITENVNIMVNIYTNFNFEEAITSDNEKLGPELKFSVYPNPASNYLKFDLENIDENPVIVTVMNLNGETVIQKEYHNNSDKMSGQLDISGLIKGMYIIYFRNGKVSEIEKFIKH